MLESVPGFAPLVHLSLGIKDIFSIPLQSGVETLPSLLYSKHSTHSCTAGTVTVGKNADEQDTFYKHKHVKKHTYWHGVSWYVRATAVPLVVYIAYIVPGS